MERQVLAAELFDDLGDEIQGLPQSGGFPLDQRNHKVDRHSRQGDKLERLPRRPKEKLALSTAQLDAFPRGVHGGELLQSPQLEYHQVVIVDEDGKDFLTVRETAKRLGVHENTVRNWARQGVLESAKVPGTSFLRFDARDVERLVERRGSPTVSVEDERRTIGPELVDATQLSQWASTKDAQHKFPELMRRLLTATLGVTNIAVRAGEGVSAPGWDGRADAEGSSFLPNGSLCFEFGVGAKPKTKADEDYRKRREDPAGAEPSTSIFVFATPRRWATAAKWASEKRGERFFADVRVLDADDLEGWLQQVPAVHHWISEQLGRRPQDAETLEQWWERFQSRTTPPLPAALFLAGRASESQRLSEFLAGQPQILAVQSTWRDDALAFVWATIERLTDAGKCPQPPLVVSSADVWNRLVAQSGRMTLLPLFDGADLAAARQAGHHVVICLGWEQVTNGDHISLPRVDRHEATDALEKGDLPESEDAYQLSALARRSLPALVRRLARNPAHARPPWAQPPDGSVLAILVLVGAWTVSEDDTAIIGQVTGKPWEEIEPLLLRWRPVDDPPFVRPGMQWHLASAQEAFALLHDLLSAADLARWEETAAAVLLERDPRLDLTPDERPMASLTGATRKHSSILRRGLAQGIALLSTADDAPMSDGISGSDHARRLVGQILQEANEDTSGKVWASLADELTLLAEACPLAFLDAVHADLDRPEPVLRHMFQDHHGESALFSSSPHTGLLWALEVLCWSPEFLSEASRALARLAAVDPPGGRLSNRPKNSLAEIFVGWIRHTGASTKIKVEALGQITRETPDLAWELLLAIWPSSHATSSPPSSPRFRDWKPESRGVAVAEWAEFVKEIVRLAVALADQNLERWAEMAERLGPLPPEQRELILDGLNQISESESLEPEGQLTLWERIDREVARHRRHQTADWALSEDLLARMEAIAVRLEPKSDVARHAYLFDWRPDLPGAKKGDDEYNALLAELRQSALKESIKGGTLDGIRAIAARARAVNALGWELTEVAPAEMAGELLEWLESEDPSTRAVAEGWAARMIQDKGIDWLRATLARPDMTHLSRRIALVLQAPATSEVWDLLAEVGDDLYSAYWKSASVWRVTAKDTERAVKELLQHGRPWQAVDLLTAVLHESDEGSDTVPPETIATVFDHALSSEPQDTPSQSPGYEIGVLLDYLEAQDFSAVQLVRYEFAFFPLLENYRQPRALYAALGQHPDLFVDLVKQVYRGKNQPPRQLGEEETARVHNAWRVLEEWRRVPGTNDSGTIDSEHLNQWVTDARMALSEADRADIGDEQIGAVLSASPDGEDGIWPAKPVREVIERIGSTSIESGIHTGVINSRGITSRGVYDGGEQERELATKYRAWAKECLRDWPRTSRVLRSLAETYEREARRHDVSAEISGDTE